MDRHPVIIGKDISEGEAWEMVFEVFRAVCYTKRKDASSCSRECIGYAVSDCSQIYH